MIEDKKQENNPESGKIAATIFKVILGLAFLALGAMAVYRWWDDLWIVARGCLGLFLILAGIITLAIARE